jgi:hypothetical protein
MSVRDVILYELNEVPWRIVDYYVDKRPDSNFAALVGKGQCLTTVDGGPEDLQPWRTWPTLHASMYEHNSLDLGQDPTTFRGDAIWDVAEKAGLSVGLFGPLQSWPPRRFAHGGFFVPDTFSHDGRTFPQSLQGFQDFNLAMTRENGFSADRALDARVIARAGVGLVRHGFTARSVGTTVGHLLRERRDGRYKAFRPAVQVLPTFDLYWRLHRTHRPRLSIFFTNHVAAMMHRYWGDALPEYAASHDYHPDAVYGEFVLRAMDLADRQLGHLRRYAAQNPRTMVVVAASMGQGPVDPRYTERGLYVLQDHKKALARLGLPSAERGLTMYPSVSLIFDDAAQAEAAVAPFASVCNQHGQPMFCKFRVQGCTLTFQTDIFGEEEGETTQLRLRPAGSSTSAAATAAEFGFAFRPRLGGDNTAYHIPEGMMLAFGAGVPADPERKEVDILDIAPSLLANVLHIDPGPMMNGIPSLFTASLQ